MYVQRKKVSRFNQQIRALLRMKKKDVDELAKHLDYEVAMVEKQLDAENTFPFSDLVKICSFLNQLPADFFYERFPEDVSGLANEMKGDPRLVSLRISETHKQIVSYFGKRVIYN